MRTYIDTAIMIDMTTIGKPRLEMKLLNDSPAYDQIIILGGSPIRVAAPQRFDAIIIGITKRTGFISKIFDIDIATGTMRNIVVTLSRNADNTAVIKKNEKNNITMFHLEYSNNLTASHSNTRV